MAGDVRGGDLHSGSTVCLRRRAQGGAGKRIFERLWLEHPFAGGYTVVKDYVRIARSRSREVFVPLAHPPGHAQVDFGECFGVIGAAEERNRSNRHETALSRLRPGLCAAKSTQVSMLVISSRFAW
jgi:hypothetical protein